MTTSETGGAETTLSDYIIGLEPVHINDTQFKILPGTAFVPALGRNISLTTEQTITLPVDPMSAHANELWYVYLYEDQTDPLNPVVTVEASLTVPVQYYRDSQHKTGAATHRRIAVVKYDSGQDLIPFAAESLGEGKLFYTYQALPQIMSWGSTYAGFDKDQPIGPTAPKAFRYIPSRTRMLYMKLVNDSSGNFIDIGARPGPFINPPWELLPNEKLTTFIQLRDDQIFTAAGSSNPAGGAFRAVLLGFYDQR